MTSIKELLELDSKQTIFGTNTQINTFGGWGSDNKAFIKASPDMAAKLREMVVELLPEIKRALERTRGGKPTVRRWGTGLKDKLDKWENS